MIQILARHLHPVHSEGESRDVPDSPEGFQPFDDDVTTSSSDGDDDDRPPKRGLKRLRSRSESSSSRREQKDESSSSCMIEINLVNGWFVARPHDLMQS
jgi:hypothetical protein